MRTMTNVTPTDEGTKAEASTNQMTTPSRGEESSGDTTNTVPGEHGVTSDKVCSTNDNEH